MSKWKISAALAAVTVAAVALAPRLQPTAPPSPPDATLPELVAPISDAPLATGPQPLPVAPQTDGARRIDVVIALDTSGSMDALIDSARARLWDIVNGIDERDPEAELRVGLLAFGSPSYGEDSGYVRVVAPLTSDLDQVYSAAWKLHTDGGDEFVGAAIDRALTALDWADDRNPDNRRLLFVAGNEGALQGPLHGVVAAQRAAARGVQVSTLYAGDAREGRQLHWDAVAAAGGGQHLAIDAAASQVAVAATPFDAELALLNQQLNATYVPIGEAGKDKLAEVQANDRRAGSYGLGGLVSRISSKGSKKYKTESWDLVGGVESGAVDLAAVPAEALPTALQGLDADARRAEVEKLGQQRQDTTEAIQQLTRQRQRYIAQQQASQGEDAGLDEAIGSALDQLL